jgi:Bacterial PH domain
MGTKNESLLTVRPRRISIYAWIGATLVVALSAYVSLNLRFSDTGIVFLTSDAIATGGLGLLFALGVLLVTRPRLRVFEDGLRVRNILGERFVPWGLVRRIAFPEGANWAQLDMADDETMPIMAIQAMDRQRAVTALQTARDLHERFGVPVAEPTREFKVTDPDRPLGRLEQIDQMKLAQGRKRPHGVS